MQGDTKVIDYLNKGLRSELTAIHQYTLHARLLAHWGLHALSAKEMEEGRDEMGHADRFMERILFLEGMPEVQELDPVRTGEDVKAVLESDLAAEKDAIALYREAVAYCESVQDYPSRDLFAALLADEEGHHDFLETQLDLIDKVGIKNYQQAQMGTPPKA